MPNIALATDVEGLSAEVQHYLSYRKSHQTTGKRYGSAAERLKQIGIAGQHDEMLKVFKRASNFEDLAASLIDLLNGRYMSSAYARYDDLIERPIFQSFFGRFDRPIRIIGGYRRAWNAEDPDALYESWSLSTFVSRVRQCGNIHYDDDDSCIVLKEGWAIYLNTTIASQDAEALINIVRRLFTQINNGTRPISAAART